MAGSKRKNALVEPHVIEVGVEVLLVVQELLHEPLPARDVGTWERDVAPSAGGHCVEPLGELLVQSVTGGGGHGGV